MSSVAGAKPGVVEKYVAAIQTGYVAGVRRSSLALISGWAWEASSAQGITIHALPAGTNSTSSNKPICQPAEWFASEVTPYDPNADPCRHAGGHA
jgi:hypothetical protein